MTTEVEAEEAAEARAPAAPPIRRTLADDDRRLGPLFLLPTVIYIVALVAFPFGLALLFSFSDITVGDPSFDFAGLDNFRAILADRVFRRSLGNTFVFTGISMVLTVVLAKILAMVLVKDFKGKWIVRFLVLLPWTTPVALATISWLWMLHSIYSPIDWVLRQMGFIEGNLHWLGQPDLAMASVIAVQTWRIVPLAAVIVMVGLIAIPDELTEAARVDGAGFWRTFTEITLPLTLPIIAVAVLFGAVLTFTDMTIVFVLTNGGPVNSTQVLSSYAFLRGVEGGALGQGAAVALFLFPLLLAAVIAILSAVRRIELF